MAMQWMRRAGLAAAAASALLLAACGGGTVASQFSPSRIVAFGDAMADNGQTGAKYTVNDGSTNNWALYVANQFGQSLAPTSQGGLDYAWGNARVTTTPDAAGDGTTPTVKAQIDQFLASNTLGSSDLVIVSAGTSDVVAEVQAVLTGAESSDQMTANLNQAGSDLADQIKRLVAAGATHVVVAGPYNLGRTPWANQTGQGGLMESATSAFNQRMLVSLVNYGTNVLYIDAALYFNQQSASGSNVNNYTDQICTSADAGPGIGTGSGQVNSRLCTTFTLVPGVDYSQYLWADRVYPTPRGHQLFGDYAYGRIHDRW